MPKATAAGAAIRGPCVQVRMTFGELRMHQAWRELHNEPVPGSPCDPRIRSRGDARRVSAFGCRARLSRGWSVSAWNKGSDSLLMKFKRRLVLVSQRNQYD